MRHTLRFATVVAAALAFTACSDSAHRAPTEPGGARFSSHGSNLSLAQLALLDEIRTVQQKLYACVQNTGKSNQLVNKANDINTMAAHAEAGRWNDVATKANQIINDTKGLIQKGAIPATCPSVQNYNRDELASYFYLLLNAFAGQGDYSNGGVAAVPCTFDQDCEETGNGWKVEIPANSFPYDVIVTIRPNNGAPPAGFNTVGNSFHFDVFPPGDAVNPWTRYICWEGTNDLNEPNEDWLVMVRQKGDGTGELLPTQWEPWPGATCTSSTTTSNMFLNGAYKLLAGMPFFPKELHAYSPPRTFGGTSTASSPHFLAVGGIWNGKAQHPTTASFNFSATLIVTSFDPATATATGEYRVGECNNPAPPCASVAFNPGRFFTGSLVGDVLTFTIDGFRADGSDATITLEVSESEGVLTGTQVVHATNNPTFNLTLTRGESAIVTAPPPVQ